MKLTQEQQYILSALHSQHHACYQCTGDLRNQRIIRHCICPQTRNISPPALEELINIWDTFLYKDVILPELRQSCFQLDIILYWNVVSGNTKQSLCFLILSEVTWSWYWLLLMPILSSDYWSHRYLVLLRPVLSSPPHTDLALIDFPAARWNTAL